MSGNLETGMTEAPKPCVLLVDDRPENLTALERILEAPDLNIVKATSGNDALALMLNHDFALVLLDVQMPDMDGFETAELMRGSERTKHVPLIFVTAISTQQKHVFKGYESGAVDYIFKPVEPEVLTSKVQVFLDLHKQKRSLERTSRELRRVLAEQKKTNESLRKANQTILEQQKSVIEEERLKVLLQMAGATAHELNQPLMALLGNVELMSLNRDKPEKLARYVKAVEEAGQKMSEIVRKISSIQYDSTRPYADSSLIIDLDQRVKILTVVPADSFQGLNSLLQAYRHISMDWAGTIREAMILLEQDVYHLILLDYFLPDGNGADFLKALSNQRLDVPVVIVTGQGNELIASQALQAGAYDYLPREMVNDEILVRSITASLGKFRIRKEVEAARIKMADMSTKDELTGLYNRRYFGEALEREVSRARRYETPLVLCIMDLDHFKKINDTYGHPTGDMVLSRIGGLLKAHIRQSDLACRYGGEEFAVILPSTEAGDAVSLCERFRTMVSETRFECHSAGFQITISVGIGTYDNSIEQSPAELIRMADTALYKAKHEGRNRVSYRQSESAAS